MNLNDVALPIYAALIANEDRKFEGSRKPWADLADSALDAAEVFVKVCRAREAASELASQRAAETPAKPVKRR